MQGYCNVFYMDYFEADNNRSTYLYAASSKFEHSDISHVIYHKFSHRGVSCMFNEENLNIMLES